MYRGTDFLVFKSAHSQPTVLEVIYRSFQERKKFHLQVLPGSVSPLSCSKAEYN